MYPSAKHRGAPRSRKRALSAAAIAIAAVIATIVSRPAGAQSASEKITRAVRRATAFTADLALGSVKPIDLEARALTTIAFGGITVGVSAVQVLDTSALRVRAYFLNSTDAPVRIPVPPEDSFVVVDARGRRLTTLASPKFARLPNGATELTLPPLERVEVVLLFARIPVDATEVMLKVGATGIIRGIPLRGDAMVAPFAAAAASPATPAAAAGSDITTFADVSGTSANVERGDADDADVDGHARRRLARADHFRGDPPERGRHVQHAGRPGRLLRDPRRVGRVHRNARRVERRPRGVQQWLDRIPLDRRHRH